MVAESSQSSQTEPVLCIRGVIDIVDRFVNVIYILQPLPEFVDAIRYDIGCQLEQHRPREIDRVGLGGDAGTSNYTYVTENWLRPSNRVIYGVLWLVEVPKLFVVSPNHDVLEISDRRQLITRFEYQRNNIISNSYSLVGSFDYTVTAHIIIAIDLIFTLPRDRGGCHCQC